MLRLCMNVIKKWIRIILYNVMAIEMKTTLWSVKLTKINLLYQYEYFKINWVSFSINNILLKFSVSEIGWLKLDKLISV